MKREIYEAMKKDKKIIHELIKFYNQCCRNCKAKMQRNPSMAFDKYCDKCQKLARKRLGKWAA